MTVNSILRSMAASARRSEREAIRQHRELERQQKQLAKFEAIQQAAFEVEEYENRIELLQSLHQDCSEHWDWQRIKDSEPPVKPNKTNRFESIAIDKLQQFKPSLSDKLLKKVDKKRAILHEEIELSKKKDEEQYKSDMDKHNNEYKEWEEIRALAERILLGNIEAYREAIEQVKPLSEVSEIGSAIDYSIKEPNFIDVILNVNSEEVIPKEVKTQLKSGKLSVKEMPKSKFNELYQDYVCSCILRVARELFALLPIEKISITAEGEMLNSKTGYLESQPILSVLLIKSNLMKLNFDRIDPSDAMQNFVHNMNFKKAVGFIKVNKVNIEN